MKKAIFALTTAILMIYAIAPAASAAPDTDTVCLTWVDAGLSCATGRIGSLPAVCADDVCDVTLTASVTVTPVACGWVGWTETGEGPHACATQKPEQEAKPRPIALPWLDETTAYLVKAQVCVTDPTITVTFPCKPLEHTFTIPGKTSTPQEPANVESVVGTVTHLVNLGQEVVWELIGEDDVYKIYAAR